jgi:hypothetical protein
MAQVIGANQIKLNNGQVVQAQNGGWYDAKQFWNGTLGDAGAGNNPNQTDIYKQPVPTATIAQTDPANVAYVNAERAKAGLTPSPTTPQPTTPTTTPTATPTPSTGTTGALTTGAIAQPTINLPQLYESMYQSSGIRDIEAGLTAKTNEYNAQVAKIKDNPYLSEATMTGRISKLEEKYTADANAIKNDVAMKKADIETKLNLESKQFDIESDQVKLAWDQFNTLLSSGALDNASGEDIAQLTRTTGISSSMIQSAIGVSKAKNAPKVNTQVIQVDDGTNISAVVIDQDTGKVINTQVIGQSKPKSTGSDAKVGSSEYNATALGEMASKITSRLNSYGDISPADWQTALSAWLAAGLQREDFIKNFGQYADTQRDDFATAYGFENPSPRK